MSLLFTFVSLLTMGTSTMGSDLHSDKQEKLLKLQARKKELETLLTAKNEELYKLCVQEVQFTGIMPPEAPLSQDVSQQRDRVDSVHSASKTFDGEDARDSTDAPSTRRHRHIQPDRINDQESKKHTTHRLSTPSISGISIKSSQSRYGRRPETSCSNYFPSPPQERMETFSMHTSNTFPSLSARYDHHLGDNQSVISPDLGPSYRHQAQETEFSNKIYFNNSPELHNVARLRETHFSSSHPDITTPYSQKTVAPPNLTGHNGLRSTPLLYQYASHLKAQNQHLSSLSYQHNQAKRKSEVPRRNTLQRTQTYHLTSHSDYSNHIDTFADSYRSQVQYLRPNTEMQGDIDQAYVPMERIDRVVPNTLPLREQSYRQPPSVPLQVTTEDYRGSRCFHDTVSPVSQSSCYNQNIETASISSRYLSQEIKNKEKHWYETSLDSPTLPGPALPIKIDPPILMKKSSNLKRSPSVGTPQTYEMMSPTGRQSVLLSPGQSHNTIVSPNKEVPLESPKNLTVIEQGKWIPYREVTKPFEMSDFYKYSTKFRQANAQRTNSNTLPSSSSGFGKSPMDLPQYVTDNRQNPT